MLEKKYPEELSLAIVLVVNGKISSVFENADCIVVHKPHGWLTTPARHAGDERLCLGRELEKQLGIQLFPVHRLDFEVEGLVLWAKNQQAHKIAQKWFEFGTIVKTYRALSLPGGFSPPVEWVDWHSKIVRGKRRSFEAAHGKASHTQARVVEAGSKEWTWELRPLTGRPHQLRLEMARHGVPIIGDVLYGGRDGEPDRIELCAKSLDLSQIQEAERLGLPFQISL